MHTTPDPLSVIFGLFALYWLIWLVVVITFVVGVPTLLFLLVRNVKKTRLQLERLNNSIEGGKMNITFTITDKSQDVALKHVAGAGAGPLRL